MSAKDTSSNFIDRYLDRDVAEHIDEYKQTYARNPDGSINQPLADRIEWEVSRRGEMGKQLDIYEPLRWIGIKTVIGTGGAVLAIKLTDKLTHNDKAITTAVVAGVAITTAISNGIDAIRVLPRYNAGLQGGLDTALKMYDRDIQGLPCDAPKSLVQQRRHYGEVSQSSLGLPK